TGFFDLDVVADDVEDVEAAFKPFNGVLGNHGAILTNIGFRGGAAENPLRFGRGMFKALNGGCLGS
ncbi:MAG: hypothetical protein MUP09_01165, partial [Thiovulaceae bacterium]|nr:hypothetical protein [Sulfurimonadaceae bacterium]